MTWAEEDIIAVETPCEHCGSLRAVEIGCNYDDPDASVHSYLVCADCSEER